MPKKSKTTEAASGTATTTTSVDAKAARTSARAKKSVERLGYGEGLKPTAKRRAKSVGSKSKAIKKAVAASPKKGSAKKAATKTKKAKKEKDPNKPKRPMSAFVLFGQDNRERIKKENPAATFGEVGKLLGEEWSKASDAQKKKYIALYEQSKKEYEKTMTEYRSKNKTEKGSPKKK